MGWNAGRHFSRGTGPRPRGRSGHEHAAVDVQFLASDVGGARAGHEGHGVRDVRGLAQVSQGDLRQQRFLLFLGQGGGHVGFDEAWGNAVHRDVAAAQLARQRAGHAGQPGLGGRVVGLPRIARSAHHAGDADDAAIALLHHGAHDGAAEPEHGLEVGVEHGVPILVLQTHGEHVARDARVVDEDMQGSVRLDDLVDERLGGLGVVDVEHRTPAAGAGSVNGLERRVDLRRAVGAGGGADHGETLQGEFVRDGRADAARRAGHQGHLAREFHVRHVVLLVQASRALTSVSVAGSYRAAPWMLASMRLVMPASTLPGPHSTMASMSRARMACTHSTQRTGPKAWRYSASRMRSASDSTATSMLLIKGMLGVARATPASFSRRRSAAGFMRLEWNGADTGNGNARLAPLALSTSQAFSTAALLPAITVCAGSLKFTASTTSALPAPNVACASAQPALTRSASMPRMAAIAPVPTGTASCMAAARKRTSGAASARVSTPAATSALYSPNE